MERPANRSPPPSGRWRLERWRFTGRAFTGWRFARWPLERWISWLGWFTCLSFVWGLSDSHLRGLPTAPLGPRAVERGDAAIVLTVATAVPLREGATATVRCFSLHGELYHERVRRSVAFGERVTLGDLPRGEVWLLVEAEGHARSSRRVHLGAGTTPVAVDLEAAQTLTVAVHDETGGALGGATVLVNGHDPLPHGALVRADGNARFAALGAPPWVVTVAAPGFETVTRHEVRADIAVTLRNLGALAVRVEQEDGSLAIGAMVVIVGTRLWPPRRAVTGADGTTRIAGLLAGTYDLRATLGQRISDPLFGLALGPSAHESVTLRLRQGRFVTVWVTDGEAEDAPGLPGADVVVVEDGLGPFPERGRTGTDGKVRLGPLPLAPASVAARAEGFVARAGVPAPAEGQDEVRVALMRAATLSGEVVDGYGRAIEGATVEVVGTDVYGMPIADSPGAQSFQTLHFAWSLGGPPPLVPAGELGVMPGPVPPIPRAGSDPLFALGFEVGLTVGSPGAAWVSGVDGRFTATPVAPGRIRAFVRHPAYVEGISAPVVVAPGGKGHVRVVLEVGGNLEGRLVDERGFPVAGARVEITAARGTTEVVTFTADDGTFAFAAIPAEVIVSLARPDEPARIVLARPLTVTPDRTTKIELVLPVPREPVKVLVLDGDGQPVDGAQVTALGTDPDAPFRETRFTDAAGQVELEDARGRALSIIVEALRLVRATTAVAAAPAELEVTLSSGVLVTGQVTAVRGRFPLAGARLTLVSDGQRLGTLTDSEGRYRLHDVPPGPAQLVVSHPEHATVELAVTIERTGRDDRPRELPAIDLVEPGAIAGTVRDAAGRPVPGARVGVGIAPSFLPAGKLPPGLAVTDTAGRFRLDSLAPGEQELEAYAADAGRGTASVVVTAGRTTEGTVIVLAEAAGEDEPPTSGNVAITLGERGDPPEVVVVHVAPESEAERAGLRAGDVLGAVDGVDLSDMTDARARLGGRAGTDVVITVLRAGTPTRLRVAREVVRR